jgi:hypothetical protein
MTLMKEKGTWYVPTMYAGRFVADKAKIDGYFPEIVRPEGGAHRRADPGHRGQGLSQRA